MAKIRLRDFKWFSQASSRPTVYFEKEAVFPFFLGCVCLSFMHFPESPSSSVIDTDFGDVEHQKVLDMVHSDVSAKQRAEKVSICHGPLTFFISLFIFISLF